LFLTAQPGQREKSLLGLVLTPTRELALQVCSHLTAISKLCAIKVSRSAILYGKLWGWIAWIISFLLSLFWNTKVVTVIGGLSMQKQTRLLDARPEIIVATPGRLWELISQRHVHLANMHSIRYLVIDEADRMVWYAGIFKLIEKWF
jgi:ATP-dependent RNA helicase DDX24/MAK5